MYGFDIGFKKAAKDARGKLFMDGYKVNNPVKDNIAIQISEGCLNKNGVFRYVKSGTYRDYSDGEVKMRRAELDVLSVEAYKKAFDKDEVSVTSSPLRNDALIDHFPAKVLNKIPTEADVEASNANLQEYDFFDFSDIYKPKKGKTVKKSNEEDEYGW